MATRHYFRKAIEPAPKPPKVKRPDHRGKNVLVEMTPGHWVAMKSSEYAMQIGRSKGGLAAQASGKAYKWTSETATKAIKKCWKVKWSKGRRIGVRLGRPAKLRKPNDRIALRALYNLSPVNGIMWHPANDNYEAHWTRNILGLTRVISERQALTVLGHLAGMHARVPIGKVLALKPRTKEQA